MRKILSIIPLMIFFLSIKTFSLEVKDRIDAIKNDYGIYFHSFPESLGGNFSGKQISEDDKVMVLEEVERFLDIVPKEIVSSELKNIFVADELKIVGRNVGAAATPKNIYLSLGKREHIRNSLFHEFSHILEVSYPIEQTEREKWIKLLPDGVEYDHGKGNENPFYAGEGVRKAGFVIQYSIASLSEDMAVLSDYVFTREEETKEMIVKYPIIKQKVKLLIERYKRIHLNYDFSMYDDVLGNSKKDLTR
jgi:hypothetical protein